MIYAVGAQTDRRLGIPGEDLPGSWAATELVAWYNGHPDFQDLEFDLSGERAVVIGNGNVALDVARMLALTREELAPTDTTDAAIEAIVGAGIREIVVLGRRGPVQAAWTSTELGEMGELAGADVIVDPAELALDSASEAELEAASNIVQRNVEILRGLRFARTPRASRAAVRLRFRSLRSRFWAASESRASRSSTTGSSRTSTGACARCRPTNARRSRAASSSAASATTVSAFRAYRSTRATGTIPNVRRRVLDETGAPVPGVYCAGWIKRGPTGVIGTNKKDATETVELLLEDARAGRLPARARATRSTTSSPSERCDVVLYAGWERIDRTERARGEPQGRPRIKLSTWDELLAARARLAARRASSTTGTSWCVPVPDTDLHRKCGRPSI